MLGWKRLLRACVMLAESPSDKWTYSKVRRLSFDRENSPNHRLTESSLGLKMTTKAGKQLRNSLSIRIMHVRVHNSSKSGKASRLTAVADKTRRCGREGIHVSSSEPGKSTPLRKRSTVESILLLW